MNTLPLTDIIVPEDRQRREFDEDKLALLLESLVEKGLFHPILIRPDSPVLIAGERRLRAFKLLNERDRPPEIVHDGRPIPLGHIPYTTLAGVSPEILFEAELEENLLSEPLTWQEETAALARLHEARGGTATATAEELERRGYAPGKSATYIRQYHLAPSLILAKKLEEPEVYGAPNAKEGLKAARRLLQQDFEKLLGEKVKEEQASKPPAVATLLAPTTPAAKAIAETVDSIVEDDGSIPFDPVPVMPDSIKILDGPFQDHWSVLEELGGADVIIVDPPYGINAGKIIHGTHATTQHTYEDTPDTFYKVLDDLLIGLDAYAGRIKPQVSLFMFFDFKYFERIRSALAECNWWVRSAPLIWDKGRGRGHLGNPAEDFRQTYEPIIYATRGARTLAKPCIQSVFYAPPVTNRMHGAQKPVELYKQLLGATCLPGETVFEPCAGSAPAAKAAHSLNLYCVSCELDASVAARARTNFLNADTSNGGSAAQETTYDRSQNTSMRSMLQGLRDDLNAADSAAAVSSGSGPADGPES